MKEITTGAITAAAAGPLAGTLDTSTLTDDTHELIITAWGLKAGEQARIAIEDTVHADGFSAETSPVLIAHFSGAIDQAAPVQCSIGRRDLATLRAGVAHSKLRANLLSLTTGATITTQAYLQGAD